MDNIFTDESFIKNKGLEKISELINDRDLAFLDDLCYKSIKIRDDLEMIDYIDIDYIKNKLNSVEDEKLRIKYHTLLLINYSFDLTFNLQDNKTLSNIFSLDIDIDKKMFNLIDFKYDGKIFKLKDRLVLSLQKNMNLTLLNFLIKHFKNELNFSEFKLEQDFLYKGSLYKDFILKAIEVKLFDFNNLNIKCYSNKFTILNYLARTTIFHDSNEPSFYKDTFIFYYSLGYNYDFDELANKYKVLIEDIKEAKQNLKDNKSKLNFILQTMHIDINNDERDLINKAKNSIKTIDNLKQDIQDIIYKIELGNIELERERNRNK